MDPLEQKAAWPYLKKYGHWAWLIGAGLFFAVHYMPAAYLSELSADTLIPVVFYQDIVQQGHSTQGWAWGGASFLFPDLILVWMLNYLFQDGLVAVEVASMFIFAGWIVGTALVYRASGGRKMDIFAALAVMLFVALAWRPGICPTLSSVLFISYAHSGGTLIALACLAMTQRLWLHGYNPVFWLMSCFLILGISSDSLLIIIFTLPAILSLAAAGMHWPARSRMASLLGGNILISSLLGFLLSPYLFPIPLAPGYLKLTFDGSVRSLEIIRHVLSSPGHGGFAFFLALEFTALLFCCVMILPFAPWNRRNTLSSAHFFLLAYGAFLIVCSWGAAILTGNYSDDLCLRYASFALVYPLILFIGWISESIPWQRSTTFILFLAVSVITLATAIKLPAPSDYYTEAQAAIPVLQKVMAEENVHVGLADYWYGNLITFLSHQTVPLRAMNKEGKMSHWFNDLEAYTGNKASPEPPSFRIIAMGHMDSEAIQARFGNPVRIIPTPAPWDIWVLAPEDAIRYYPIFNELGNRRQFPTPNQFGIPAANLPSQTGKVEGTSLAARTGRDRENCLSYGPYLHAQPGRYRIDFVYCYEVPPVTGKEATYDCILTSPAGEKKLDDAPIPYLDRTPKAFSREIVVPKLDATPDRCVLETRTFFHQSGDIRIDSLSITYLDP